MRLLDAVCPHCGANLKIENNMKKALCEHCGATLLIDDGVQHIQYDNAEEVGYNFEKGRQKARRDATQSKRLKKKSRVGLAVILIAVMLICGFVFWRTRELEKDKAELDNQLAQIQDQIDYENRQNQAITNEIKYRQTDDYIEDQARDTFGLRDEDETIFKPGKPDE